MKSATFTLIPGTLSLADLQYLLSDAIELTLEPSCYEQINAASEAVANIVACGAMVYGINTGFGSLAKTRIAEEDLWQLQYNLIVSHCVGTGEFLADETVRLLLLLKINSLARGYSGVRAEIIEALITLFNAQMYPCIPAKGSVGASGDLAPLAHMTAILLGEGEVRFQGKILTATKGLAKVGLKPLKLAPKEGLALINGTQASTALALQALLGSKTVFAAAMLAGSLSVDAVQGSDTPFDPRLHEVRGQSGQQQCAAVYRDLLHGSEICNGDHDCEKIQDPYSIRCQPQVMGACLDHLHFAAKIFLTEANGVSDNPIVFAGQGEIVSGGNFHAEPIAMAADTLALVIAEVGALAERRIALLIDEKLSGLPAFLITESGINSGFMIAHVTAAALASENKSLAHPACVDSLPTSANQEDHVSMATFAARRLLGMLENTAAIVAIELLAACQGVEFRLPLKTSPRLQVVLDLVREHVANYQQDRYFAPDIAAIKALIQTGRFDEFVAGDLF